MCLRFTWQAWHLATCAFVSRGRRGTWRHLPARFAWQAWHLWHVAGVALGDMHVPSFHVAPWRLATSTFVLRGRRGTYGTGLASGGALGLGLVAGDAAALCVAGVALGDMCLRFTWQAWHLATSTCVLRGRRQAWHLRHWAVSGGALGPGS